MGQIAFAKSLNRQERQILQPFLLGSRDKPIVNSQITNLNDARTEQIDGDSQ